MGNYNPHAPYIIGNEWVPIRQADYKPDKITEQGYSFRIDHSAVPITGAYYVAEVPQTTVNLVTDMVAVYAAGDEDLTGPIKQVTIPASAIWVTGTSISVGVGVAALQNPSDQQSIRFNGPTDGNTALGISFDVPSYIQQLGGKRILDVSFLYSIEAATVNDVEDVTTRVGYAKNLTQNGFSVMFEKLQGTIVGEPTRVNSFSLGSTNILWDATRDPYTVHDAYPWRYEELARFAATEAATSRMLLRFSNQIASTNNLFFNYVAMKVTYCEERRILYGGRSTTSSSDPGGTVTQSNYETGPNLVRLFNTSFASNATILTPGNYVVTLSHDDWPIDDIGSPTVRAIRELYQVGPQQGIRVNKSLTPDDTFDAENISVITEITLHTSSAVVTGVHPYGIQDDVPVYGSITATQEIEDDPAGTAKSYPQVRFYARRFGNTTIPLTLVDVATGLSTVSISVADFDALPEIVDGWREVNLRFATAPTFSTAAGDVDWRWTATGESAKNQWQVLGAGSAAFAAHSIGPASYYAPQGNTVTLTWQSPPISGTAEDTLSDAVLIFATDPPSITGFAVETQSQAITGIAEGCLPGNCIPTHIDYNELSWVALGASSVLVTGGSIEVQRSDALTDWATIMLTEDLTTAMYRDYEARVGMVSQYRIRTLNALDFAGSWVTGSGTIVAPGVVIGGSNAAGNSVLIFTSNESPSSNLAYVMQWEGQPIETFAFPEADEVQLQRMFGKDFFTAFHPLERGGDQFTRVMLVNAAAIPVPSLANFNDLRDLAWASLNYVCVRDELGNRWFANILVPEGNVRMNRTIYLAQIQVSEVTDTPTPIAVVVL